LRQDRTAQAVGANIAPVGKPSRKRQDPEQYKDHAWFIAFAPKDHAKIAALVSSSTAVTAAVRPRGDSRCLPAVLQLPPRRRSRDSAVLEDRRRRDDRSAALMASGDRRYILHFDWMLFILVLSLAGIDY